MIEKELQEAYYFDERRRKISALYRQIYLSKLCGYGESSNISKDCILQLNNLNSGKKILILENGKKLKRE